MQEFVIGPTLFFPRFSNTLLSSSLSHNVCFEDFVLQAKGVNCISRLCQMPANQQIICHIFHADIQLVCQITLSEFSICTSTFYLVHSTLPYITVNETLPYILIHTSIFFYNKPTLPKKHCWWELSLSKPEQWLYVNTADNPADCATRPSQATSLIESTWIHGSNQIPIGNITDSHDSFPLVSPEEDKELHPEVGVLDKRVTPEPS